jgi:hypothetical protein
MQLISALLILNYTCRFTFAHVYNDKLSRQTVLQTPGTKCNCTLSALQVRDLVERCTCPVQFPMIRVSEGKYRIGDTKVLIFVRVSRHPHLCENPV